MFSPSNISSPWCYRKTKTFSSCNLPSHNIKMPVLRTPHLKILFTTATTGAFPVVSSTLQPVNSSPLWFSSRSHRNQSQNLAPPLLDPSLSLPTSVPFWQICYPISVLEIVYLTNKSSCQCFDKFTALTSPWDQSDFGDTTIRLSPASGRNASTVDQTRQFF